MKILDFMLGFFENLARSALCMKQSKLAPMRKDIPSRSTFHIKKSELGKNLVKNLVIELIKKDVSQNEINKLL